MPLSRPVAVITSDEQALIVATDLAEDFKRDSALRDRERRLPHPELEVFSRSGLWGISVPKAFGGAGVSNVTLAKVIARIAQADASLGQIPQNHFYALEVLRVNGSPEQQARSVCARRRAAGESGATPVTALGQAQGFGFDIGPARFSRALSPQPKPRRRGP